jgi:undecaprenyl-diphosphatase
MDTVITVLAQYLILVSPLVLLQILWTEPAKEKFRFVALILLSFLIAYIAAKVGTHLYENPRPFVVGQFEPLVPHGIENGFPSMHTLFATTIAVLVLTKRRMFGVALLVVALMVGIARVQAGVHHGIDILASLAIAPLAVLIARKLLLLRIPR